MFTQTIRSAHWRKTRIASGLPPPDAYGMIAIMEIAVATAMRRVDREASMKRVLSGILGAVLAVAAPAALAQSKPPLKLGGILDMSGLYADLTGAGSETAAKMAVEDFGGEVLGRK